MARVPKVTRDIFLARDIVVPIFYRLNFLFCKEYIAYTGVETVYDYHNFQMILLMNIVKNSQVLFYNGSLLHSEFNTQSLITIGDASRILTGSVIQLLIATPKTRPTSSSPLAQLSLPFAF
jgi:hypothetical protein